MESQDNKLNLVARAFSAFLFAFEDPDRLRYFLTLTCGSKSSDSGYIAELQGASGFLPRERYYGTRPELKRRSEGNGRKSSQQ